MSPLNDDSAPSESASPSSSQQKLRCADCLRQLEQLQNASHRSLALENETSALLKRLADELPPHFESLRADLESRPTRKELNTLETRVRALEADLDRLVHSRPR